MTNGSSRIRKLFENYSCYRGYVCILRNHDATAEEYAISHDLQLFPIIYFNFAEKPCLEIFLFLFVSNDRSPNRLKSIPVSK